MGLNDTPMSERIHIGIFGRRNAGKSSLINAITGQNTAVVSDQKGTTTDPVVKAMELLPVGPVILIDTPGLDDDSALGQLRIEKGMQAMRKCDVAVYAVDAAQGMADADWELLSLIQARRIPIIVAFNKMDMCSSRQQSAMERDRAKLEQDQIPVVAVSAATGEQIAALKAVIARKAMSKEQDRPPLVRDLVPAGGIAVLVTPIDSAAPKGRLILPQQQTIRDLLDGDAQVVVVKQDRLKAALLTLKEKPRLVVTDSQVFEQVAADTPEDIPLTSFSILFARYKGGLAQAVRGVQVLASLKDGDGVLISEGCTHHRQCGDIGTEKLPNWILAHTGKKIDFAFTSGTEFPESLSHYRLIVHCGGCMLNEKEMRFRAQLAESQGVPMTNYGILIAWMKGILTRSLAPFPEFSNQFALT